MRGESHPVADALGCAFVIVIVVCILLIAGLTGFAAPLGE